MSDKLKGANDMEKLRDLASRTYKAQAVWFLNAFWDEHQSENEKLWAYVDKIARLDLQKGAEGAEVDELQMHKFLESFQETMTVREMRDSLRAKGAIGDAFKYIALIHYLIFRYGIDFHVLVNAPQGDNRKELEEAQRMLDEVSKAFQEADDKSKAAKAALAKAKAEEAEAKASAEKARVAEADAKAKEAESKVREAEAKAAQVELEAALAEVKAQEDAFNAKTNELKRKSEEGSVVQQNKAKNELAQHLSSDPLPLRKAKITQEAAVKKAERASKAATEARTASEEASRQATSARASAEEAARRAEASRKASEEADRQAEAAVQEAQKRVAEAEAYLAEVKSRPGKAAGAIWWMERELYEKKKFMPVSKGGIAK